MKVILPIVLFSLLIVSCTYGTKNLNSEIATKIKEGESTKFDVAKYLGPMEEEFQNVSLDDENYINNIFGKINIKCCSGDFSRVGAEGLFNAKFMLKQLNNIRGLYSVWYYYRQDDTEDWLWPLPDTRSVKVLIILFNDKNIVERKILVEDNQAYWWFID